MEGFCILIGAFDLGLLIYFYMSPPEPNIYPMSAVIWVIIPAMLLIFGASMRIRSYLWPWVLNNFAIGYFFLFASIQSIIGSPELIENAVAYLKRLHIIDLNVGFWTIFGVIVFFHVRLIIVAQLIDELHERNMSRNEPRSAPISGRVSINIQSHTNV